MPLKNLPHETPIRLQDLISCRPGQISSMGLTREGSTCSMTLLAFSSGESVSEETYGFDILYQAMEGCPIIVLPDSRIGLEAGQAIVISAGIPHAVEGAGNFKILQVAIG